MPKSSKIRSVIAEEMIKKRTGKTRTIKDKRTKRDKDKRKSWRSEEHE